MLKTVRAPPDSLEEYRAQYGSLGPYLQQGVTRARQQSGGKAAQAGGPVSAPPSAPGPAPVRPAPAPQQQAGQQKVFLVQQPGQVGGLRLATSLAGLSPAPQPGAAQLSPLLLPGQQLRPQQLQPGQQLQGVRSVFSHPGQQLPPGHQQFQ